MGDSEEYSPSRGYSVGWCEVLVVGDKAMLVRDVDGERVWYPHSQIAERNDLHKESVKGDEGEMIITDWLARQRGWI
jgi:hypothetical protein